jgi:hypothetical protein
MSNPDDADGVITTLPNGATVLSTTIIGQLLSRHVYRVSSTGRVVQESPTLIGVESPASH